MDRDHEMASLQDQIAWMRALNDQKGLEMQRIQAEINMKND